MALDPHGGDLDRLAASAIARPLLADDYLADPSARVFEGRVYVYASHDVDSGMALEDSGEHFKMVDYRVLSMDRPGGEVTDHGSVVHVDDVPWARRQMWAPDAATKDGRYYLYFPAKDDDDRFRIGVAVGDRPEGPFTPDPQPIDGTYSIDPAVLADDDGAYYLYFGGIWGGQLQKYRDNAYADANEEPADDEPALGPRVGRLADDLRSLAEPTREVVILDEDGRPLLAGDHDRRFFEGPWVHRKDGRYVLSYSTGDTRYICWATSDDPYGPFTYQGRVLAPVIGWTTQHSIVEADGRWWLFYHDSLPSGGVTHLRSVMVTELEHDEDGRIVTVHPYGPDA